MDSKLKNRRTFQKGRVMKGRRTFPTHKPLLTIGIEEISEEDYNYYFHKWLYQYGGAGDVVSLEQFIHKYDSDMYGDINHYSSDVCPCVMCMEYPNE